MLDNSNHFIIDVTSHTNLNFYDGQLRLSGHLNYSNVMDIFQQSLKYFKENKDIVVDFAHLDSGNSAVIALIVEWLKLSKKLDVSLRLQSLSQRIVSILKSADIYSLIEDQCESSRTK